MCAGRERLGHVLAGEGCARGARHRADRGLRVARIAQPQPQRLRHETLDERLVHGPVHVDPLDPATRLTGVEERSVGQVRGGVVQVGVGSDVAGVLAAQLQADLDEPLGRRPLDGAATLDRAGEVHVADARVADHVGDGVVAQVKRLDHAVGHAGLAKGVGHPLGHERGLRGVLQQHRVAGQQGRYHRVHGGQERVVPRRQNQDHAVRDLA